MAIDEGHAIHYTAVERGTPVYGSDEVRVGKVDEVVDNYREHILDGIVVEMSDGELRFADGPEVQRTFERAVILNITSEEAAELPPPERAPGMFRPRRARGRLGRLFGGGWRRGRGRRAQLRRPPRYVNEAARGHLAGDRSGHR